MNRITQWFYGMGSSLIGGAAGGGAATISVAIAAGTGYPVTALSLQQTVVSVMGGGIVGVLLFLKSTPLPPLNKP